MAEGCAEWTVKRCSEEAIARLQQEISISRLAAKVYLQRGIRSAQDAAEFTDLELKRLHPIIGLPDQQLALDRLIQAIERREKIFAWGDYDVDGITATAVIVRTLRRLNADIEFALPHRLKDGYDFKPQVVERARESGASLLVTVDCGIRAFEAAEFSREAGIDLIITDHHQPDPTGRLPHALAVVNPSRQDSNYPFPGLAGVGVAFKLMLGLAKRCSLDMKSVVDDCIEYAALGTVADVAEMRSENRILVHAGCQYLADSKKEGVRQLLRVAQVTDVDESTIGWRLGPRINAVGRLGDPIDALNLLLSDDAAVCAALADRLEHANKQRQGIQERMVGEALKMIESGEGGDYVNVLWHQDWHPGVVGLVAGDVARQTSRPSLIISVFPDETARGSCRSHGGLDILRVLQSQDVCPLFDRLGGHAFAAGFTLKKDNLPKLRDLADVFVRSEHGGEAVANRIEVDAEAEIGEFTQQTYQDLLKLAPFGNGHELPMFMVQGVTVRSVKALGSKGVSYHLIDPRNPKCSIWAKQWHRGNLREYHETGAVIDVLVNLEINSYLGRNSLELSIEDSRQR